MRRINVFLLASTIAEKYSVRTICRTARSDIGEKVSEEYVENLLHPKLHNPLPTA